MIKKRKTRVVSDESIQIADSCLTYSLIRSKKRTRSLSMKLDSDGQLLLSVPYATAQTDIENFIISKYSWIRTKQNIQQPERSNYQYILGEKHRYLGQLYPLDMVKASKNEVKLANDIIYVFHRTNSNIRNLVIKWYRQQALDYLTQRTLYISAKYNFPHINLIKVRNMKARWGSCSSESVITYNIHLIKADVDLVDYVIIHELCHLIHANHGAGFYRLQSQINPQWKDQKQRLNALGAQLIY